jgi:putative ABC transport system permease protein
MIRVEHLIQDARYAFRTLRRSPLFTVAAVACLAIGVAANTTMFSVFDAIVLRPLPFDHPEQLVSVSAHDPASGRRAAIPYAAYAALLDGRTFGQIGAYRGQRVAITQGAQPEMVRADLVSATLFPMLGVRPQIGRGIQASDDNIGAPAVALLGEGLWQRQYGGDPSVVGRTLSIDHQPYTVIGVMPPGFKFPELSELWMPLGPVDARAPTGPVSVIGRLRSGGRPTSAVPAVTAAIRTAFRVRPPEEWRDTLFAGAVRSLASGFMGSDDRVVATAMLGATLCLLLIACANVANLLLTRAIGRQREFAMRTAIGASRGRLAAQMATEGVVLAAGACAVALPLTWQALGWIQQAIPPSDPYPYYVHWALDGTTFLYAACASLLTGALFGLGPTLHVARGRLTDMLKENTAGAGTSAAGRRARHALVVGEVALALVLLVGASLFVRTFVGLRRTDLGYDAGRVMTMRFYLPGAPYDSVNVRLRFVDDVLRRVRAVPGVSAATVSDLIPLDDEGGADGRVVIEGEPPAVGAGNTVLYSGVAGDWFRTFGASLVTGRTFMVQDERSGPPVAIVNRLMAQRFWPGRSALGRRFRLAGDSTRTWYTVVGIAPDIRTVKLDENRGQGAEVYLPARFVPTRDYGLMVRTPLAPSTVGNGVRDAIHSADGTVPVFNVWTMNRVRYLSFWMYAMWEALFAAFGAIALVIAAFGVYAVIYYGMAQRTHEIGVRVALGAGRGNIVSLVLRQGLALALAGVVVGLLGALALTRVVGSLLINVSATDPLSFAGVALLLTAIVAVASYLPARRATAVDPLVALRQE